MACDGYTTVKTPDGLAQCCGFKECHDLECQNKTHTVSITGKEYACCGTKDCYKKYCDEYVTGILTPICCGYEECVDRQCVHLKKFGSSKEAFELDIYLKPEDLDKKIYLTFGAEECATFLVNGKKYTEYHYNYPGCSTSYNRPDWILFDLSKAENKKLFKAGMNKITGFVFNPDSDKNFEYTICANFHEFIKPNINTWGGASGPKKEFLGEELGYVPLQ